MTALLCAVAMNQAHALMKNEAETQQWQAEQAVLDSQCEAGRMVLIEPIRAKAYDECMHLPMSTDTSEDCHQKADGYHGQNANGSQRFYDIPECVAAFEHRKLDPRRP